MEGISMSQPQAAQDLDANGHLPSPSNHPNQPNQPNQPNRPIDQWIHHPFVPRAFPVPFEAEALPEYFKTLKVLPKIAGAIAGVFAAAWIFGFLAPPSADLAWMIAMLHFIQPPLVGFIVCCAVVAIAAYVTYKVSNFVLEGLIGADLYQAQRDAAKTRANETLAMVQTERAFISQLIDAHNQQLVTLQQLQQFTVVQQQETYRAVLELKAYVEVLPSVINAVNPPGVGAMGSVLKPSLVGMPKYPEASRIAHQSTGAESLFEIADSEQGSPAHLNRPRS